MKINVCEAQPKRGEELFSVLLLLSIKITVSALILIHFAISAF